MPLEPQVANATLRYVEADDSDDMQSFARRIAGINYSRVP